MYPTVYFPMTANILTPGHVKCLQELTKKGFVVVGLLTKQALKGYKKELVPYKDRLFLMEVVASFVEDVTVVPQKSLDPTKNLKMYNCTAIASGDGWEPVETKAAKKLGIKKINIKLKGEKKKKYSSSKLIS